MSDVATSAKGRAEDGFPEGVDADDALSQLHIPRKDGYGAGLHVGSVHQSYNLLRERGRVSPQELIGEVFKGSHWSEQMILSSTDWYKQYVEPFLGRLPGAKMVGSDWVLTPADAAPTPVPSGPIQVPTEEAADANIRRMDFPGAVPKTSIDHYKAVKAAYEELREEWTLSRAGVCAHFTPASGRNLADGLFTEPEEWYAMVACPALAALPDVEPPVMPAGEWVYTGLGPAEETTEGEQEQ